MIFAKAFAGCIKRVERRFGVKYSLVIGLRQGRAIHALAAR